MTESVPLGNPDRSVPSGSHVCAFYSGEMPSVLNHPDGRTEFFRFEAMLNQFSSPLPLVVLWLYDLDGMGAEVLMQALRTHAAVIVDGMIHENPYFIEPSRFLARIG